MIRAAVVAAPQSYQPHPIRQVGVTLTTSNGTSAIVTLRKGK